MKLAQETCAHFSMLGAIGLTVLAVGAGCGADAIDEDEIVTAEQGVIGDFLPGLQVGTDLLAEAEEAFLEVEGIDDGVGPIFNERACGTCHDEGATGGAGDNTERRFGRFVNGAFDPLANRGGSLRQLFATGPFTGLNGQACNPPVEVEPAEATVRNVGRRTQPLFGLGLVDSLPDSTFDSIAARQPPIFRGTVQRVKVVVPNPGDPSQSFNSTRVARFGWKGGVPSLLQFSADAYVNEMAITTQSCFKGTSLNAFAIESAPNGVPTSAFCDDRAARQTGTPPGGLTAAQWAQVDDAVGSCSGGRTEIQDDVFLFAVFMTALAPPPRASGNAVQVAFGSRLFDAAQCSQCHVRTTFRTPANPPPIDIGNGDDRIRVPANFSFRPFSDFLVHDMGSLGDRIGNAGDSEATTRRMRTQPLWGNRFQSRLLHDGRCGQGDIACAIRAHDGQAAISRITFNALGSTAQNALVAFVRSL
jgi:CxxC motif-containing protein (DUF1111 family)